MKKIILAISVLLIAAACAKKETATPKKDNNGNCLSSDLCNKDVGPLTDANKRTFDEFSTEVASLSTAIDRRADYGLNDSGEMYKRLSGCDVDKSSTPDYEESGEKAVTLNGSACPVFYDAYEAWSPTSNSSAIEFSVEDSTFSNLTEVIKFNMDTESKTEIDQSLGKVTFKAVGNGQFTTRRFKVVNFKLLGNGGIVAGQGGKISISMRIDFTGFSILGKQAMNFDGDGNLTNIEYFINNKRVSEAQYNRYFGGQQFGGSKTFAASFL